MMLVNLSGMPDLSAMISAGENAGNSHLNPPSKTAAPAKKPTTQKFGIGTEHFGGSSSSGMP